MMLITYEGKERRAEVILYMSHRCANTSCDSSPRTSRTPRCGWRVMGRPSNGELSVWWRRQDEDKLSSRSRPMEECSVLNLPLSCPLLFFFPDCVSFFRKVGFYPLSVTESLPDCQQSSHPDLDGWGRGAPATLPHKKPHAKNKSRARVIWFCRGVWLGSRLPWCICIGKAFYQYWGHDKIHRIFASWRVP